MAIFKELEAGSILGESQYYKVEKIVGNKIQLLPDGGESIIVDSKYVEKYLDSADQFNKEEKITKTQLADLFINNPRIVMTVAFYKASKVKSKKAYKAELMEQAESVGIQFLKLGSSAIEKALENPVLSYILGELRVMRGRHYGDVDDLGRMHFTDMDATDARARQVDPRTIQYVIIDNIKYILK